MLKVEQLNVSLQRKQILFDIDFSITPGTFISVLGPNGAGKSTFLKALSGDIDSAKKSVTIEGKLLQEYSSKELANLRSVMPQSIQLDFPFLVSEIIEMSLVNNIPHQARAKYVEQALEVFDVCHLKDRNYLTLSGGEQQRVQLARVIAQITINKDDSPRYLFLDECTASLDLAHQHQVFEVVSSIVKEKNIAVISVLHDLNLASQYSDELVLMQEGRIINQGTVAEVLTEQQVSSVYGYPVKVIQHPKGWPMIIPA
jgi:iron complex transport system ATP-binding protein